MNALIRFLPLIAALTTIASAADKPNIVLINADDLGYGDLGCYGATQLRTPNIDRLAREGRRFTDAHSPSAVCSPSRYGLLTGRYPFRRNLWGPIPHKQGLTIDPSTPTLASLLRSAGYDTACIGKWHLGFGEKTPDWNGKLKPGPLELGFDRYFGIPAVNSGPPFVYVENHRMVGADPDDPLTHDKPSITRQMPEKSGYNLGGAEAAHRLYVDEKIGTTFAEQAVDWIGKRSTDTPFFLYLATTNIHHPVTPAERFVGTSECGRYGDFVHELDWIVGEVLEAVEALGATDNTLVIFTSDNGGMLNVTGQKAWETGHRLYGDLLGFKFGAWEGGHRVPMIARWPGRIPAGSRSDELISQIDLFATFAGIVGHDPGELKTDSLNQLASFTGDPEQAVRETLIIQPNSPKHLSIRSGPWLYIPEQGSGGFQGKKPGDHLLAGPPALAFTGCVHSDIKDGQYRADAPDGQLYHLGKDPGQATNVIADHPDVAKRLADELNEYREQIPSGKPVGWINLKQ